MKLLIKLKGRSPLAKLILVFLLFLEKELITLYLNNSQNYVLQV